MYWEGGTIRFFWTLYDSQWQTCTGKVALPVSFEPCMILHDRHTLGGWHYRFFWTLYDSPWQTYVGRVALPVSFEPCMILHDRHMLGGWPYQFLLTFSDSTASFLVACYDCPGGVDHLFACQPPFALPWSFLRTGDKANRVGSHR